MGEISKEPISIKSEKWPWMDKCEEGKFVQGIIGETPDYWKEEPILPPCCKGEGNREWLPDSRHHQEQMYCRFRQTFINPCGFDCDKCARGVFPTVELWKTKYLPMIESKEDRAAAIIEGVRSGDLSETDALKLVEQNGL